MAKAGERLIHAAKEARVMNKIMARSERVCGEVLAGINLRYGTNVLLITPEKVEVVTDRFWRLDE
jgi:hypothetical protein